MFYGRKIRMFNLEYQLARKVDLDAFSHCTLLRVLIYAVLEVKLKCQIHICGQICDRGCIVCLYTFSLCSVTV